MYAGNLAWSVKPEDLRNHLSQFGTVISIMVVHAHKGGKNCVYGFLSFSSSEELEAAMSLDGTVQSTLLSFSSFAPFRGGKIVGLVWVMGQK